MFRHIVLTAAGLAILAGPALSQASNGLPANLQRQVDPVTTYSVPQSSAPAYLQGRVFVEPRSDRNQLPAELEQKVDRVTTYSVPHSSAPVYQQGKVFLHPSKDTNQLPAELR